MTSVFWDASECPLTKKQHNKYFWKGLLCNLRYAISNHLEARDADFESDQIPGLERAMEAGQFVKESSYKRWMETDVKERKKVEKGEVKW